MVGQRYDFADERNYHRLSEKQMPELDFSKPLTISVIGEGAEEDDGDGYINFV